MKRKELIKNKGYHITKIQNELFRQLHDFMTKNNMNRTQLAEHLGFSKGYVSQVLNGNFDFKLSKLVELSLAMGMIPEIKFTPIDEFAKKTSSKKSDTKLRNYSKRTKIQLVEESAERKIKNTK
jgi:predicted XRE-type DNA-binding protein